LEGSPTLWSYLEWTYAQDAGESLLSRCRLRSRKDKLPCFKAKGYRKKRCHSCTSGPCSLLEPSTLASVPSVPLLNPPPVHKASSSTVSTAPLAALGPTPVLQVVAGRLQGRLESLSMLGRDEGKKGLLQACLEDLMQLAR
jgi:hypothetical protein